MNEGEGETVHEKAASPFLIPRLVKNCGKFPDFLLFLGQNNDSMLS